MGEFMDYAQLLESRGISLARFGLRELALKTDDALLAVGMFARAGVPILGGDVYFAIGSQIQIAYANWSTRQLRSDTLDSYLCRSCSEATRYISEFPKRLGVEPLFVIVGM
jgi:hypothetical protein